ncbi:MAG TPA: SEC-C metal-binding domain-containing protein [Thermoanaerobaculia bacterium]|nr:SEC-C metal-binding domain-containing protein [Thermoanaerobaculia bacterium]
MDILGRIRSFLSSREPVVSTVGRNDPCPCGSGKKFKLCCIEKVEHERLAKLSANASQSPFGGRSSPANRALTRMRGGRKKR